MKTPAIVSKATIPDMPDFTLMPRIVGKPQAAARLSSIPIPTGEGVSSGIWECSAGVFRRQVAKREFSCFIAGHCIFTPDHGEAIEIKAGDAAYFPAHCDGTWDVREPILKTYIIID